MNRIVGGSARGRRLRVPAGATRPTSDRMREALFSTLSTLVDLTSVRFADLYAGSGAVGLEALSRGAREALLVESSYRAAAVIKDNITSLGLSGARLITDRVERLAIRPATDAYDVIFADPPYALPSADLADALVNLGNNGWLASDAIVVVERASRDPEWVWPATFVPIRHRGYGEGTLWYGRRS